MVMIALWRMQATIKFKRGAKQTVTVRDVQRVVENNVIDVLSSVSADIHSSSATTCSATSKLRVDVGDSFAECDVAVSASAIVEETNAVADAGAALASSVVQRHSSQVPDIIKSIAINNW